MACTAWLGAHGSAHVCAPLCGPLLHCGGPIKWWGHWLPEGACVEHRGPLLPVGGAICWAAPPIGRRGCLLMVGCVKYVAPLSSEGGLIPCAQPLWGSSVTGRVGRGVWARVSTRITGHLFPAPRKGGRGSGPATAGEPSRAGPAWGYGTVGSLLVRGVRTVSSCGRPGRDPGRIRRKPCAPSALECR